MSDYIKREDAKAKKVYSHERHEYVVPVAELDWLPAAPVREVVKGHWVHRKSWDKWVCSNCSCELKESQTGAFCKECGADMREPED